jgi:hypothetical protein
MFKVKWLLGICILYMLGVLGLIVYAIITPATTTTSTSTGIVSTNAVPSASSQTTSTASTNFNDVNSVSSTSGNNLSLSLSLDGKIYEPGQSVSIIVEETNLLPTTNSVPASDNLPSGFASGFTNEPSIFPFGLAVVSGNYTLSNLIANPLLIYDPRDEYIGPQVIGPTLYSFQPSSDGAYLEGGSYSSSNGLMKMQYELQLNGYWDGNPMEAVQDNFNPGVYTVVAGDEWGALVLVHFTVTS